MCLLLSNCKACEQACPNSSVACSSASFARHIFFASLPGVIRLTLVWKLLISRISRMTGRLKATQSYGTEYSNYYCITAR